MRGVSSCAMRMRCLPCVYGPFFCSGYGLVFLGWGQMFLGGGTERRWDKGYWRGVRLALFFVRGHGTLWIYVSI